MNINYNPDYIHFICKSDDCVMINHPDLTLNICLQRIKVWSITKKMIKVLIIQLLTKPGVKYKNLDEYKKGKMNGNIVCRDKSVL